MMTQTRRIAALAVLLTAAAAVALAQGSSRNDSVDYAPAVKTVAGTLPVAESYELAISAPTQLNDTGMQDLPSGITASLRVNVASYPDGSSEAEAAGLVSLDDSSLTFFTLGETHTTTVRVAAGSGVTPGDYAFDIQAVGPPGIGWGIASHRLNVSVAAPVISDSTPPDVLITSPANGQAFTFCTGGTAVPVTISAVDAESLVTAVGGTANGVPFTVSPFAPSNTVIVNGSFTASDIGAYAIEGWATSAGGTGISPTVTISVNYAISWLPPLSLGRTINGAVAIKFAARDCEGTFVADTRVHVEVWEGSEVRYSADYGDGSDSVRIEDGIQYVANFHPAAGNHTYTAKVYFNGYLQASLAFSTR